jgi:hypothetical protein
MPKKWASVQKIKCGSSSYCNKTELGCRTCIGLPTGVRKAATIFLGKIFQRTSPPALVGVMFLLEGAWILFLAYALAWLLFPGGL